MSSPARILASALAFVALSAGCDMGLQDKLDAKKTARFEAAREAVFAIEASRTAQLSASVPAEDAKFEGNEHPMQTWRKQIVARGDSKDLVDLAANATPTEGMKVGAKGTPAQLAAEMGATFAKEAGEYWNDASSLGRYTDFLDSYFEDIERAREDADKAGSEVEAALAEGRLEDARMLKVKSIFVDPPFYDEAEFDRVFVHAARFWQLTQLKSRAQVLHTAQADWEIAFDFPAKARENFSNYVSRLCFAHPTLSKRCKDVPHELRAMVIDQPFLQWLKARADDYKLKNKGNKVFADVLGRFSKVLAKALEHKPPTKEDPILPSTFAAAGGISGMRNVFSKQNGIFVAGQRISDTFDGTLPKSYAKAAAAAVETVKNTPGNRINYQRAVLEAPGDIKLAVVRDIINGYPAGVVKRVALLGRRRVDESMRRASMALRLPHPDTSRSFAYAFAEDAKKTSCTLMGFMGEAQLGQRDYYYLELTPEKMRVAPASRDDEARQWSAGATTPLGAPSSYAQLDKWMADKDGQALVFISDDFSYDEASKHLSHLLFECADDKVAQADPKAEPLTRVCGKTDTRDLSLVVYICE